jgi:selenocysteine lyase/cysteine desulfurase
MNKYKKYFSKFLTMNEGKVHFACHSHHYWPDCTREAQTQYWDDSSKFVDDKWELIFSKKVPQTQRLISKILDFDRPQDICFAPNTHELVYRVLSSFQKKIKILTTDSEFYSFSRQLGRLVELQLVEVKIINTFPIDSFEERFLVESKNNYDVIFLSQVFFNSGIALKDFSRFTKELTDTNSQVVIDGYHGFMAIPTNLKAISDKIFYIAGSYKYAAGGEGCCFMTIPKNCKLSPRNTGWFAELGNLDNVDPNKVPFPNDGLRFAGSTFDFTSLYRLTSVLELYEKEKITVDEIHEHVQECQKNFLKAMNEGSHILLNSKNLILRGIESHGHFLTFDLPSSNDVQMISETLKKNGIQTDSRETRLRFGFSIYHDVDFDYSKIFKG